MNTSELSADVAKRLGGTKSQGDAAVKAVLEAIQEAVKAGDKVSITGFGIFSAKQSAARTGRNPRTGETVEIAAKTTPAFKAGKGFVDALKAKA